MTFLRAENLLDAERFSDCATLALSLLEGEFGAPVAHDEARMHVLLAKALQGAGLLEQAAESARAAVDLTAEDSGIEINIKARQALIAALADGGRIEEAWEESKCLAGVISDDFDDQLAGKAYWVIGNVAFLCGRIQDGLRYHELAAATFSPTRNLDVWAKFNRASAAMRLAANVADTDTLRCIERAELATDVVGGSELDLLLLKRNRAHWSYLAGDAGSAVAILEGICTAATAPQVLGDAWFLLAKAYLSTGDKNAARQSAAEAVVHFESAGAPQRAQEARDFLKTELGRDSFVSSVRRAMRFGRN